MIKMYTVAELHATLPKGTVGIDKLKTEIKKAGTYRDIGGAVLLTDGDWRNFLEARNKRRQRPDIEPGDAETGVMVVIWADSGTGVMDKDACLLWCERGAEVQLCRDIEVASGKQCAIVCTCDMTYGEYKKTFAEVKSETRLNGWRFGKWFVWRDAKDVIWKKVIRE